MTNFLSKILTKFNSLSKPQKVLLFIIIACIVVGILVGTGVIPTNSVNSATLQSMPSIPLTQSKDKFVYEFIVNVPAGPLHVNEVTVDGNLLPPGSFVLATPPDRSNTSPVETLSDGTNAGVTYQNPPNAGDLFMTVTLDTRPTKFTMMNSRPLYTPGWIIKENGIPIITENSNRGPGRDPVHVTYDYILP